MRTELSYSNFITMCNTRQLSIQFEEKIDGGNTVYRLFCWDGNEYYFAYAVGADATDFETNHKASSNKTILRRNDFGVEIISPTLDDVMGLYPKKKSYKDTVEAGSLNIYDIEVSNEKRINGGEYWIHPDDIAKVHDDDYVEFAIVDKNNILGLFSTYGLTVGNDILEICKFVLTDYVKKGNSANGFHSQLYEGIRGTNRVIPGLFMRVAYNSFGSQNIRFLWRIYFYE